MGGINAFCGCAVLCVVTGNIPALLMTVGMTLGSLAIGATIAGYQSHASGKGFWRGFERYIGGNWAQSVAISSLMLIVTIGISAVASAVRNAGSTNPPANVAQETICSDVNSQTEIIGKAHGSAQHQTEINRIAGQMSESGDYSKLYLNRSLSTTGVQEGNYLRPDIIGARKIGGFDVVEVASKSQASGSGLNALMVNVDKYKNISNIKNIAFIPWGY